MTEKPAVDFVQVLQDAGIPVTEQAVRQRFNDIVRAEGLVTNTSKMSPFWRLITAIVTTPVIWLINALAGTVMPGAFLATAGGQMLRVIAWGVNVRPKPASAAAGQIRFVKQDVQAVVTVPAGTIIQTERLNGIVYKLTTIEDATIADGAESALIAVRAAGAGAAWNLAPGYYRILPAAVSGIASAVNEDDWLTTPGADDEPDDELRERARNQFNLVGNYHIDAVYRSMIAAVAGFSTDRVFFLHDAPRGPGTANAYLLLDSGVISKPFIDAVNDYINTQGHHGHGDDMQCYALPESRHALSVRVFVTSLDNMTADELTALQSGVETLIRCAFRENAACDVKKTWPYARFSFSNLGREIHRTFPAVKSLHFSLDDIVSQLNVPRLSSLNVSVENA